MTDERLMPRPLGPNAPALRQVLELIQDSFAYMDGRIDPPSSMHRLGLADLAQTASQGRLWVMGAPPLACAVFTPAPAALYIGKLAVARMARGRGLARALITAAAAEARRLGLPALELQTRVELHENHAAFAGLGFVETGRTAHAGYPRPTSITMRKALNVATGR